MINTRAILATASLATFLAVSACSSSDGSPGGPSARSTSGPFGGSAGRSTASAAASSSTRGSTGNKPVSGGGGTTAWCKELASAGDAIPALGGNSTESPTAYKAKLARLVADAPAELRPDLQVLQQIDDQIADGDTKAEDQITQPATLARVRRLARWMESNCRGVITDLPSLPG